ncbi:MAG: OmpH family outer membrane protein [Sphaerochaetaceae bacterium]|nr:OmpH family outer membrane protein [Sphaerochaetaceae bacterium]
MKKDNLGLLLAIVAILFAVFTFVFSSSAKDQVYVDVNKLIEGYKKTEKVRADFKVKATQMQANVDSIVKGWQTELQDYEKTRASMTKKELKLKQELLANKQQQVNNYQEAVKRQLRDEDQKNTQTILNDINDYVKEYGKEHGYAIIFGATGSGNIMYAAEGTDLTEAVLVALNKDYKK